MDKTKHQFSSMVLPFPQTRKAIRHYETGMGAAGFLSLQLMERDGEAVPANVRRYDQLEGGAIPSQSPELLLALCIWGTLPPQKKESVKATVRALAYARNASPSAVQLHNLLKRGA
jgi:hypothetical protein